MYVYAAGAWVETLPKEFKDFSSVTLLGDLTVYFCACLVLVVVVHLLLSRTRRGRYFTAVGDNAGGATLVGISAVRTKVLALSLIHILLPVFMRDVFGFKEYSKFMSYSVVFRTIGSTLGYPCLLYTSRCV